MYTLRWIAAAALLVCLTGGVRADETPKSRIHIDSLIETNLETLLRNVIKRSGKKNPVVGTLKFQARFADGKPSYTLGPINSAMAERMQTLMVVGSGEGLEVQMIHDASEKAAEKKLDHYTPEGCKGLFKQDYTLVTVDKDKKPVTATADIFLTGLVTLDIKGGTITVDFATIVPGDEEPKPLSLNGRKVLSAPLDRSVLSEAGLNYTMTDAQIVKTRGAFDAHLPEDNALQQVKTVRYPPDDPKQADPGKELVRLEMYVKTKDSDQPTKIEFAKDSAGNPTWKTNRKLKPEDEVYFTLVPVKEERMAVVLMVNGMNTLYRQKEDPRVCSKWILEKGAGPLTITGFYVADKDKNLERFEVLADSDQRAKDELANNYSAGYIQMHVFIEGPKPDPKVARSVPVTRGLSPQRWKDSTDSRTSVKQLKTVFNSIRKDPQTTRGLLSASSRVEEGNKLETRDFMNPQEVQALTIRYHDR